MGKPIELQARTLFRCEKCWDYSPKLICRKCFPSPCFPLKSLPKPPIDYEEYKKWDAWFIRKYMLEWVEEPEAFYEIGSEAFDHEVQKATMQKSFKRKEIGFGVNYRCKLCKVTFI